jgi:hypothetical protein
MNEVNADKENIIRRVLLTHAPLLIISSMYSGVYVLLTRRYKVETHLVYHSCKFFLAIIALYFSTYSIFCVIKFRPSRPLSYLWDRVRNVGAERQASFVLVVAIIAVYMVEFMYVKSLIPVMHPFEWDETFARWDAFLHGTDPWRLVQPYLAPTIVTEILVITYVFYFLIIFTCFSWQAASQNSIVRMQFLLTFILCWILLGTVMATKFSSAGPCFYHHIIPGSDPYSELMAYLESPSTPASITIQTQKWLWYYYENHEYGHLFAISAMPSMHVAVTFLLVLAARNRITRVLSVIFTIAISLACIHLAWHYAIDVYAGIIGTWLIWWIVGLCLRGQLPFFRCRIKDELQG